MFDLLAAFSNLGDFWYAPLALIREVSGRQPFESHAVRHSFGDATDQALVEGLLLIPAVQRWLGGELGGDLDAAGQGLVMG